MMPTGTAISSVTRKLSVSNWIVTGSIWPISVSTGVFVTQEVPR